MERLHVHFCCEKPSSAVICNPAAKKLKLLLQREVFIQHQITKTPAPQYMLRCICNAAENNFNVYAYKL
jgi:hypothetical protein